MQIMIMNDFSLVFVLLQKYNSSIVQKSKKIKNI